MQTVLLTIQISFQEKTVGAPQDTYSLYVKNIINPITYVNNLEFLKKRQSLSILRCGDNFT